MDLDDRYARHRLIDGWDQERLGSARLLVAGAGAIGNEVIKLLALLGFGHILIVDFDRVEFSNLTRSPLFRETDIGRPKAEAAAERAREINPDIAVRTLQGDLQFDLGLGTVRSMDVVLGCLDSLQSRLALNRACMRSGTPWINGAIEVSVAEVSLFRPGSGACFECAMTPEMWRRRAERFSCGGLRSSSQEPAMPTTAIVASLAAAYMVQEALHLIHARGSAEKEGLAFSQKLTVNLSPYETAVYALPLNPECLAHEEIDGVERIADFAPGMTAAELLRSVGCPDGEVELGFDLVTEMRCVECDARAPVRRPLAASDARLVRCPECGGDARHAETANRIGAADPLASVPLSALGVPPCDILSVNDSGVRRYYQLGDPDF
jgi:adenylyltransferase/sulfurtransferase